MKFIIFLIMINIISHVLFVLAHDRVRHGWADHLLIPVSVIQVAAFSTLVAYVLTIS